MNFWKSTLTAIGTGALYLAKEAASELKLAVTAKETIKNKIFYSVKIGQNHQYILFTELSKYLLENHKNKFKNLSAEISTTITNNLIIGDSAETEFNDTIEYDIETGNIFIEENGCKIWVKLYHNGKEEESSSQNKVFELLTLKKNHLMLNEFLLKILRSAKEKTLKSQSITTLTYEDGYWADYRTYIPMPLERIFCKQSIKDELINDIDTFLAKREWYANRNIPFKRGYLLYGKPRNGKSSLVAAIARKYNMNIHYLTINSFKSERELLNAFKKIEPNSILQIDDIDKVWNKRKALNKKCPISLSTFLNLLSGSLEKENILIFFTTNYIEKLDPALIADRRIDLKIHVPNPSIVEAQAYLSDLYDKQFELKSYAEGRSVGALFNLFCDYSESMNGLIEKLDAETEFVEEEYIDDYLSSSENEDDDEDGEDDEYEDYDDDKEEDNQPNHIIPRKK